MSLQELLLSSSSALTCLHDLRTGSLLTSFKGSSSSQEISQDTITNSSNNSKGKGRATTAAANGHGQGGNNERSTSLYRKTVDVIEGNDGMGGLVVAAVPGKSAINVWSFQREAPLQRLLTPIKISCLSLSKDGIYLAAGGHDGRLLLWELSSGLLLASFDAHYRAVTCLAWTDDSAALISGSDDAACHVWSLPVMLASPNNPLLPVSPYCSLTDHTLAITSLQPSFGLFPSLRILTSSLDGTIKLWDLRLPSLPLLSTFTFPANEIITHCALDPGERCFFAVCGNVKNGRGKVVKVNLYRRIRKGDENEEDDEEGGGEGEKEGGAWQAIGGGGRGDMVRLNGDGRIIDGSLPSQGEEKDESGISSYPGRVYSLPQSIPGKNDNISSLHLSTISSQLLIGTTSGSIHILSLPSLQNIRTIVPSQTNSTASLISPIISLHTLMRPVDLVSRTGGMVSSGNNNGGRGLGEEIMLPRHVANQLARTIVQSKDMEEKVVNVRLTGLNTPKGDDGEEEGNILEPPTWSSLARKLTSVPSYSNQGINGSSTSSQQNTIPSNNMQEENARLRDQLARSIAMNEKMWEGLVDGTLGNAGKGKTTTNGKTGTSKEGINGMEVDG